MLTSASTSLLWRGLLAVIIGVISAVHDFLTNPTYAGAFVFDRTRTEKRLDPSTGQVVVRDRLVPRDHWEVLIPDHHPGFISWEKYEINTAKLRANWRHPREQAGGAVREDGPCCRACCGVDGAGRIMQTGYSGTKGNCPRYVCARAKQLYAGEKVCQSIGGIRLEKSILNELFAVRQPAAQTYTATALMRLVADGRVELDAPVRRYVPEYPSAPHWPGRTAYEA